MRGGGSFHVPHNDDEHQTAGNSITTTNTYTAGCTRKTKLISWWLLPTQYILATKKHGTFNVSLIFLLLVHETTTKFLGFFQFKMPTFSSGFLVRGRRHHQHHHRDRHHLHHHHHHHQREFQILPLGGGRGSAKVASEKKVGGGGGEKKLFNGLLFFASSSSSIYVDVR